MRFVLEIVLFVFKRETPKTVWSVRNFTVIGAY
jgi:hypothetical protein